MSVLTRQQRADVRAVTFIDPFVIDRCADAFDALLRGDVDAYNRYMTTAVVQLGLPMPIPASEKPTAVDRMKHIIIGLLAKQWRCSYGAAVERCREMMGG